nr:PREDICTED: uncharacterized protein LOC107078857 [Lepisosteus oculatus]
MSGSSSESPLAAQQRHPRSPSPCKVKWRRGGGREITQRTSDVFSRTPDHTASWTGRSAPKDPGQNETQKTWGLFPDTSGVSSNSHSTRSSQNVVPFSPAPARSQDHPLSGYWNGPQTPVDPGTSRAGGLRPGKELAALGEQLQGTRSATGTDPTSRSSSHPGERFTGSRTASRTRNNRACRAQITRAPGECGGEITSRNQENKSQARKLPLTVHTVHDGGHSHPSHLKNLDFCVKETLRPGVAVLTRPSSAALKHTTCHMGRQENPSGGPGFELDGPVSPLPPPAPPRSKTTNVHVHMPPLPDHTRVYTAHAPSP